jgi:biotin operon repressor
MKPGDLFNPRRRFVGSFLPAWLARREEVSPGPKLLYARLCQYAGEDGEAYPSEPTLARELGVAERTVRRWVKELEEWGLVQLHGEPGKSYRYRFLWHTWIAPGDLLTPDNLSGVGVGPRTSCPPYPGQNGRGNPGQSDRGPRTSCPPTPDNLSGKESHEETQEEIPSFVGSDETAEVVARRLIGSADFEIGNFLRGLPRASDREELRTQVEWLVRAGHHVQAGDLSAAIADGAAWCQETGARPTVNVLATALKARFFDAPEQETQRHATPARRRGKPDPATPQDQLEQLRAQVRDSLGR